MCVASYYVQIFHDLASSLASNFSPFPYWPQGEPRFNPCNLLEGSPPYSCFIYENIKVLCSKFKMESTREEEAKNMKEYHQHNFHKILQQREKGKNIVEELDFMNNQQKEVQHFLNGPLYHVMFMFCTPNGL